MEALRINGVEKHFPADQFPATLAELVEHLGFSAATVVAEINGKIVKSENFAQTSLSAGQSIELLRFVGGG